MTTLAKGVGAPTFGAKIRIAVLVDLARNAGAARVEKQNATGATIWRKTVTDNGFSVGEPNVYQRVRDEMKLPLAEQQRRWDIRSAQFKHLTRQRFRDPWEPVCSCLLCTGKKRYWEVE